MGALGDGAALRCGRRASLRVAANGYSLLKLYVPLAIS
jgi:hypothetical protein